MKDEIYVPREDSFFLAQVIEKEIPKFLIKNQDLIFLEIGCGNGIQLETALKSKVKKQNIFSCDINPFSVRHCKSLGFHCIQSDLFENIKNLQFPSGAIKQFVFSRQKGKVSEGNFKGRANVRGTLALFTFDLIIFNPPYLPEDSFEPIKSRVATTGGKLGSEVINGFLKQAKFHLNKNSKILLLTSSHSKEINFLNYNRKIIAKRRLFFEELYVWELKLNTK